MIASRVLVASPGKVCGPPSMKEGAVVITEDGAPRDIMIPTSGETLLDDVREIVFARVSKAIREIRRHAAETGAATLMPADIDQEIAASRRERRQRAPRG